MVERSDTTGYDGVRIRRPRQGSQRLQSPGFGRKKADATGLLLSVFSRSARQPKTRFKPQVLDRLFLPVLVSEGRSPIHGLPHRLFFRLRLRQGGTSLRYSEGRVEAAISWICSGIMTPARCGNAAFVACFVKGRAKPITRSVAVQECITAVACKSQLVRLAGLVVAHAAFCADEDN